MQKIRSLQMRMADKNILFNKSPEEVMEAIALQEPVIQQILILHLFQHLRVRAIANVMGLKRNAVYKKLQHGFYYLDKHFNTIIYQEVETILYSKAVNRVAY